MITEEHLWKHYMKKRFKIFHEKGAKCFHQACLKEEAFRAYANEVISYKSWFDYGILCVVIVHFIFICFTTFHSVVARAEWYLMILDSIFFSVYTVESSFRIYALRLDFFKSPWNIFEVSLYFTMNIDFILTASVGKTSVSVVLAVIKSFQPLRIVRLLRKVNRLESLKGIMSSVALKSIPALGSIMLLTSLLLFIFAVIGRGLYSEVDPERFGNLAKASVTLFQLLTLDDWFYMYTDVINDFPRYWHILFYLMLFIILETFIFLNLFVAVIVDNLASARELAKKDATISKKKKSSKVAPATLNTTADSVTEPMGNKEPVALTIDEYYPQLSTKEKMLHKRYWQLLVCLEHQLRATQNHQQTLDELIDLVDFTKN